MQSWTAPAVPRLPGRGPDLRLYDTATAAVRASQPGPTARMYVCGITPYDATHLGHALTFVAFDLVNRVWRDSGRQVHYVQNVTDVDDPLLERAERDGVDWTQLALEQTQLLREDLTALRVIPPDDYVGAVEAIPRIATSVQTLVDAGAAYRVDDDIYFSISSAAGFGHVSSLSRADMIPVFGANGGDPDRAGKKDPLDPLLWRAPRPGEPSWDSAVGPGRPGWHIECVTIALDTIGAGFDVQGGGRDLIFPHHEMSAAHGEVLAGAEFAQIYAHVGMVGLDGEKMSKSRGNLVFVHQLRADADPAAIRLALLAGHYRADLDWQPRLLTDAQARLRRWRDAASADAGPDASALLAEVRERLADDLDSPGALAAIDRWAGQTGDDRDGPGLMRDTVDALLGVQL